MRDANSFRNQEDSKINRYLQERAFGKMSRLFSDIVTFRQIAATCPLFVKYLALCLSSCVRYEDIWLNTIHKKPSLEISKEECRLLPGNRIWRILNPALSHLIRTSMQRKSFCKFKHDCCSRRTIGTRASFYFTCERWNTRTNGKDMVVKTLMYK